MSKPDDPMIIVGEDDPPGGKTIISLVSAEKSGGRYTNTANRKHIFFGPKANRFLDDTMKDPDMAFIRGEDGDLNLLLNEAVLFGVRRLAHSRA